MVTLSSATVCFSGLGAFRTSSTMRRRVSPQPSRHARLISAEFNNDGFIFEERDELTRPSAKVANMDHRGRGRYDVNAWRY